MGSRADHVRRAEANEAVGERLRAMRMSDPGVARWIVVVDHYTAREWIHAVLAEKAKRKEFVHPDTHPDTKRAWASIAGDADLLVDLQVLESLSMGARYLGIRDIEDSWWRASYENAADALADSETRLASIRSRCQAVLFQAS